MKAIKGVRQSMIILVGASASGKTEVAKLLYYYYGIKKVITHTTRPMRPSEVADVDYHFINKEEFLKLQKEHYFVETTVYNNNYYGTSKKEISDEKCLIVDPNGLKAFQALKDKHIVTFGLLASEQKRIERMQKRGDKSDDIQARISSDRLNFSQEKIASTDYTIDTDNLSLSEVVDRIISLYRRHLL